MNRARAAVTGAYVTNGFVVGAFVARIPDLKAEIGISNSQLGVAILCSSIGLIASLGPTARACAKKGSAWVAVPAAIGLSLSTVLVGSSHSYWELSLALTFFGLFLGVQDVSMNTHAVAVEDIMKKRMMSGFHATFSAGALLGGLSGGLLSQWKISVLHHTVAVAVIAILLALFLKPWWLPKEIDIHPLEKQSKSKKRKMPGIFWSFGLIMFCGQMGEGAAGDWGGILSRSAFHASPFLSTIPYIAFSIMMVVGRSTGDFFANRFGTRKVVIASGAVASVGLSTCLILGGIGGVIAGWIFLAAGSSMVFPLVLSLAGKIAKEEFADHMAPAEAMALVSGIAYFGFLAGPTIIGFLSSHITLRWAMLLPALLAGYVVIAGYFTVRD